MPSLEQDQLRKWALRGAEQRLLDITEEAAAIHRAFPELRRRGNGIPAESADHSVTNSPDSWPACPRPSAHVRRSSPTNLRGQKARWAKQKVDMPADAAAKAAPKAKLQKVLAGAAVLARCPLRHGSGFRRRRRQDGRSCGRARANSLRNLAGHPHGQHALQCTEHTGAE